MIDCGDVAALLLLCPWPLTSPAIEVMAGVEEVGDELPPLCVGLVVVVVVVVVEEL